MKSSNSSFWVSFQCSLCPRASALLIHLHSVTFCLQNRNDEVPPNKKTKIKIQKGF